MCTPEFTNPMSFDVCTPRPSNITNNCVCRMYDQVRQTQHHKTNSKTSYFVCLVFKDYFLVFIFNMSCSNFTSLNEYFLLDVAQSIKIRAFFLAIKLLYGLILSVYFFNKDIIWCYTILCIELVSSPEIINRHNGVVDYAFVI